MRRAGLDVCHTINVGGVSQCQALSVFKCTHLQIMNGVHENMLKLPYMDHSMEKTVAMCEWLEDFDVWNLRCMSQMQFELMPLLPAAILGASNLCCCAPSSPSNVLPAAW
jgi:hypothetical protein